MSETCEICGKPYDPEQSGAPYFARKSVCSVLCFHADLHGTPPPAAPDSAEALREVLYKHQSDYYAKHCSCGFLFDRNSDRDCVTQYAYHLHEKLTEAAALPTRPAAPDVMVAEFGITRNDALARLEIKYAKDATWGIRYHRRDGKQTPLSSQYNAEMTKAQVAGIMTDFAALPTRSEAQIRLAEAEWIVNHAPGRLPQIVQDHIAELRKLAGDQ